jgi:hypothetical protein
VLEALHNLAHAAFRTFGDRLGGSPQVITNTLFGCGRVRRDGRGSGFTRLAGSSWRICAATRRARRIQGHSGGPVRGPPGAGLEFPPHMSWPRNLASLGGCDLAHARATEIATIPQLRRRRRSGWSSRGLTQAAPRAGYADDHLPTEPLGCAEVNTPGQIVPDPTEGLWAAVLGPRRHQSHRDRELGLAPLTTCSTALLAACSGPFACMRAGRAEFPQ